MTKKRFTVEYKVREQGPFKASLASLLADSEIRDNTLRCIKIILGRHPEHGCDTGRATPFPVYSIPFAGTENRPAIIVLYTFSSESREVLLLSIHAARLA
jgi:hypothetical protein